MSFTCLIDKSVHEDRDALHKHLRSLKVKQEDYYTKYEPRRCRYSNVPIPFKNWADYLATDFISNEAMRGWFVTHESEAPPYAIELIRRRAYKRSLKWTPCEVELKSLGFPRAAYYETIGGLNAIGATLGLRGRFDYTIDCLPAGRPAGEIITDTREQLPLEFDNAVRAKLQFGDYALVCDESVAVERKSLQDFIGTLTTGYERFTREVERVQEVGGYLIVACETNINSALAFDGIPEIARHIKIKPPVVFHNVRDLIQRFECVQFLFANDRDELKRVISRLLSLGDVVRGIDLQHLYTKGIL